MIEPYYQDESVRIFHCDAFEVLEQLTDIGAVITDPPYSSGGAFRGDRMAQTAVKYVNSDTKAYRPEFAGDNRDQRSFLTWCHLWMSVAYRASVPGAPFAAFIDWRNLPTMTDAIQSSGYLWRGIAPWSKGYGRPRLGGFSNACEYVVWGSKGSLDNDEAGSPHGIRVESVSPGELALLREHPADMPAGLVEVSTVRDRKHIAEKPIEVMRWLCGIVPKGGLVVDPFMGSGSTIRAAKDLGLPAVGIDSDERYCEIAAERLAQGVLDLG